MHNKTIAILAIGFLTCMNLSFSAFAQKTMETSPHAEALMLVLSTQQEIIRRVDQNDWWHDIEERKWMVKRPFYPGDLDSTHMFDVSYIIGEKVVATWMVNTESKKISLNIKDN